jgi:hypothetical protein
MCLLAPIGTTSAGPRGPCVGGQGRQARQARSGDGDSLASGQPERGGGPRAWGSVGTGQAGEACAQARIARWQGRDTGTGGPGAQGPGDQINAWAVPATVPPSLGEQCGRCRGPETGRDKRAGGRPRVPDSRGPGPSHQSDQATEGGEETRAGREQWTGERGRTALAGGLGRSSHGGRGAEAWTSARRTRAERRRWRALSRYPIPGYPNHVTRYRGLHSATLQLYCNCTTPDIGVNVYDQTVAAVAGIPQGFTEVMM